MPGLQVNKLMHELVKLYVRYDGSVLHVVQIIVPVQQFTQFQNALSLVHILIGAERLFFNPRIYAYFCNFAVAKAT